MNPDPFQKIPVPEDRDTLLRLSWLACSCREQSIHLANIGGWILPTASLPWNPERSTALRRCCHHVESCRGILQANAECFPVMDKEDAAAWVADCHKHHGAGSWPSWWAAGVIDIAKAIVTLAGRF